MLPANTSGKRRRIVSSYETGETSSAPPRRRMSQRLRSITSQTTESSRSMQRPLPSYSDCGDCTYICEHCSALFWFGERVLHAAHVRHPRYNQCCKSGAVRLTFPLQPPPVIKQLFRDPQFLENIRAYNNMFSMTSFGANVDDTINDGRGPYVFKISGQVSHWIGSLCPPPNEKPRFSQMYIYDTENEISNRLRFFNNSDQHNLFHIVVATLSHTLNAHNKYVRLFKTASEICSTAEDNCYSIRLYNNVPDRRYGAPSPDTLGGIVCGDDFNASDYDIIIHSKGGIPQRVSKLHPSYMALQYPLLFPLGEEGVYSLLLNGGRLFQQYLVDAYTCIEQNRLAYYNANQDLFRSEYIAGMYDALSRGDTECRDIGKRIFLPSSFTGGPRYMYKHYQDALAICRVHGNPQYFITFTCNVKWPEIMRYMHRIGCLSSQNRPDVIARVFQMKVKEFIKFIKEDQTFGEVTAYLYTIEFQKRGLPHCHTLVWVTETNKIRDASAVDNYITDEFPDPYSEPLLYQTITECMIHGPCGLLNPNAPCMHEGKCSKHFPKLFEAATQFDKDGYVHYKRRACNFHVSRNGLHIDCGYGVPYNKRLCSRINAHINVEYCGWNMMIKYLFKYISKGVDRVRFAVRRSESYSPSISSDAPPIIDEIQNFLDGRFICPHEASWRILDFSLHERSPSVQVLAVHLENMQNVTFRERSRLQSVISNPSFGKTTLTEWFSNNDKESESDGFDLTYNDYPSRYRWELSAKVWIRRVQARPTAIGYLVYVHPTAGELFYLRLLLCHQKGCKAYSDVRTVSGVTYTTFRGACEALGLLGDDREWVAAFTEASTWATSSELRSLFCHLLLFCEVGNPLAFWESEWKKMADDMFLTLNSTLSNPTSHVNDFDLQQQLLLELEKILNSATPSKSHQDFGLPLPSESVLATLRNRLLLEEVSYDRTTLSLKHLQMHAQLNVDQLQVYNAVRDSYVNKTQLLLFVYGHGGTGKTFLWNTIISFFRSIGKVVLAVAASGIASLLLPSGRTAHSRFKIPIELTEQSTCYIKKNTQLADLLKQTSIVIWDEAPMSDRRCFECLDRSLKDVLGNDTDLFGGMSILLGGDFRQTLPVKPKSSRSEILNSTLPRSYLWLSFRVYTLTENMHIGNGLIGEPDADDPHNAKTIEIPPDFLIQEEANSLQSLINFVYQDSILRNPCAENLSCRAIVCPKNDTADEINKIILNMTPGEIKCYISHDSMVPHMQNSADSETLYPQEYLNQLSFPGIPPHKLDLKVNTPMNIIFMTITRLVFVGIFFQPGHKEATNTQSVGC
ncbi:uncharacterized protein LOC110942764 [Helianthus annuus]|uniref:uncharacterized protein LOC110942764 n=1 Tax=Helianthus annuus TaxID=4232 RepID=UPI000B8F7FDA|nr:uncharacterized protein LOC110942764 [Helianthus annuus]